MNYRFGILSLTILALTTSGFSLAESEPNGATFAANGPFTIPDTITGNFTSNDGEGNTDFFQFSATGGTNYKFIATPSGSGVDPDLGIWQASQIAGSTSGGANQTETLNWTAPSSGTFYLEVYSGTGNPAPLGAYSVAASIVSGINDWGLY